MRLAWGFEETCVFFGVDENGNRKMLTGEPAQVADDIYNLGEIGVSYLTLDYKGKDIDKTLLKMERFMKLVKALL